ncbi:MAG: 2-C-methyl-D-erythritol 4-phosphate cytidylyltransferase [Pseudomonadota bacterium]
MSDPRIHVIIPAAGSGQRMGASEGLPKQYRLLLGRPMLQWSLERACADPRVSAATVAIASDDQHFAALSFAVTCPVDAVEGGRSRAVSVLHAVRHAQRQAGADWVLVHDAARPCLARRDLTQLLDEGLVHPHGALLAQPVSDTLKRAGDDGPFVARTVKRDSLWSAQTPQLFPAAALADALDGLLAAGTAPTDEAGAMEALGWHPRLVQGSPTNLKVTFPGDALLAEAVLSGLGFQP